MPIYSRELHDDTNQVKREFALASIASGAIWGILAALIGKRLGSFVVAGVVVSPFLGLLVGIASRPVYRRSMWVLLPWSIGTLYVGGISFGIVMGLWDVVCRIYGGQIPATFVGTIAHVIQLPMGAVWIITLVYLPYLWPLAWINHALLRVLYRKENRSNLDALSSE